MNSNQAIRKAAEFLLTRFDSAECDSAGVDSCVRCATVFIARAALVGLSGKGRLPPLPMAFFDEFGNGADDRVQDYARAYGEACRATAPAEVGDGELHKARVRLAVAMVNAKIPMSQQMALGTLQAVLCGEQMHPRDVREGLELVAKLARLEATRPAPGRDGFVMVPKIGARVTSSHPITCLNPEPTFVVTEVKCDHDTFFARGENTCWFAATMLTPAPAPPAEPFGADFIRSIEP